MKWREANALDPHPQKSLSSQSEDRVHRGLFDEGNEPHSASRSKKLTLDLLIRKSEGCNRNHLAAKEGAQLELIAHKRSQDLLSLYFKNLECKWPSTSLGPTQSLTLI